MMKFSNPTQRARRREGAKTAAKSIADILRLCVFALTALLLSVVEPSASAAEQHYLSHPPIRPIQTAFDRLRTDGPAHFVDPRKGDDANDGSEAKPWHTINHAMKLLVAGDTLYLRGGRYFENVYCAVAGTADKPITVRSFPNELAIIDGGFSEFQDDSAKAWVPDDAAPGEYHSTQVHRNIRDVVGLFGDSNVALQTYWHTMDLRATSESWIPDPDKKIMVLPVYCGPGIWYDKQSGLIHARLAHTHLKNPLISNYEGETDPRKLPLVIAPFNSVPLFVDQAMHVRFQDLIIRGGGQNCVLLQMGIHIEFDNVTIYAGTYGIRSRGTGPLKMINSAIRGMIAPWCCREENSLYTYTADAYDPFLPSAKPANTRNICRLNTHAVVATEGAYEFDVFHYPYNHDWEVSYCEFSDGHDGVYISGRNINYHHNWIDRFQDDATYLSAPSANVNDNVRIHENLVSRALMAFSCDSTGGPEGNIYIYRNIVDFRRGVFIRRPSPKYPDGEFANYHIFLQHGHVTPEIESIYFYQNTLISPVYVNGGYAHRTLTNTSERTVRRVFNNLFVYLNTYPYPPNDRLPLHDIQIDGNCHWCPAPDAKLPKGGFIEKARANKVSEHNQSKYPKGWEASSFVADPKFMAFSTQAESTNDYRPQPDSPVLGKGIVLPAELDDPERPKDGAAPDIGALPRGSEPLRVGIRGRMTAGRLLPEKD